MEYITVNGTKYECRSIATSTDAIVFTLQGQQIAEVESAFKCATALEVAKESADKAYGQYDNLIFKSATVYADGSIEVVMHIPSETELRLMSLEQTQAEQDEAIAELIGGEEK